MPIHKRPFVDGNLSGYVFNQNGEVKRSENIVIAGDSYSPVFLSRREATVIADDIRNYSSASTFDQKYRFDERVRSFLDVPIQNFINYPAGEYLQPLYCREAWFRFGIRGNHRAGGGIA